MPTPIPLTPGKVCVVIADCTLGPLSVTLPPLSACYTTVGGLGVGSVFVLSLKASSLDPSSMTGANFQFLMSTTGSDIYYFQGTSMNSTQFIGGGNPGASLLVIALSTSFLVIPFGSMGVEDS